MISDKRSKHENQTDEKAAGLWPDVSLDLNELKIASPSLNCRPDEAARGLYV